MLKNDSLVSLQDVYISSATTSEEVFLEIGDKLYKKGMVKQEFVENLIQRESEYPTGLDLTVINPDYGNIAVPHTEGEFVNTTKVVPIKLKNKVTFHNMIQPKQELDVSLLFLILNNNVEQQTQILADIMDFINSLDEETAMNMFETESVEELYELIQGKL